MNIRCRSISFVTLALVLSLASASGIQRNIDRLVGDWTGESICVGNNASCHDEKVVYHVSIDPADSTIVTIAADKIVGGKTEPMGVINLKYDASKQTLTGETQTARYHLLWEFAIKSNVMEGTLSILRDKTVARRIN